MSVPIVYKSLTEEMDSLAAFEAQRLSRGKGTDLPYLHLYGKDGVTLVVLYAPDGAAQARMARQMVYLHEPQLAILRLEAWIIRRDLPESDSDRRRAELGEIRIADLPRDKREETLILYGETPAGDSQYRVWLKRDGGLEELTHGGWSSRFKPLYMVDELLRGIGTGIWMTNRAMPAEILDLLRQTSRGMSPEQQRLHVRNVIGRLLADGAGSTTSEWQDIQARGLAADRARIIRGGPAHA